MALVVCCPCGNPIECDQIDLVVTVNCPLCQNELTLELEDAAGRTRRAILTVMEGPFWVGEKFVVPVGVDLRIGRATGNWLALDNDSLSNVHCRLHLGVDGAVVIEDQKSDSGTWIGKQRVASGKLLSKQSFRTGDFRFRLDISSPDGTTVISSPGAPMGMDESSFLPVMKQVKDRNDPFRWFSINRFLIARMFMSTLALLMAVFHFLHVSQVSDSSRPWLVASVVGAVVLIAFLLAGRRVALAHRHLKYGSLCVLVGIAIIDLMFSMPVAAIGCLAMAASITLLILRVPSGLLALLGTTAGLCSVTVVLAAVFGLANTMTSTP